MSDKNEWETPDELFNLYHEMYQFEIDAAANSVNHKLPKWFGPGAPFGQEDALTICWRDFGKYFWLNPPYGRGLLSKFLNKAVSEYQNCGAKVVLLLPVDTSTNWWHTYVEPFNREGRVEFIEGRIVFKGATGTPRFASCVMTLV